MSEYAIQIPLTVARCPECGSQIEAQWPSEDDFSLDCKLENELEEADETEKDWHRYWHRYWQSEWQPVTDRVKAWISANGIGPNDAEKLHSAEGVRCATPVDQK